MAGAVKAIARVSRIGSGLLPPPADPQELLQAAIREEATKRTVIIRQEISYWSKLEGEILDSNQHLELIELVRLEAVQRNGLWFDDLRKKLGVKQLEEICFFSIRELLARNYILSTEVTSWSLLFNGSHQLQRLALEQLESQHRHGITYTTGNELCGIRLSEERMSFGLSEQFARVNIFGQEFSYRQQAAFKCQQSALEVTESDMRNGILHDVLGIRRQEELSAAELHESYCRSLVLVNQLVARRMLELKRVVKSESLWRAELVTEVAENQQPIESVRTFIRARQAADDDPILQRRRREIQQRIAEIEEKLAPESELVAQMHRVRGSEKQRNRERMNEELHETQLAIADLEYRAERASSKKESRSIQEELVLKRTRLNKLDSAIARLAQSTRQEAERLERVKHLDVDEDVLAGKKSAMTKSMECEIVSLKTELENLTNDYVKRILEDSSISPSRPSSGMRKPKNFLGDESPGAKQVISPVAPSIPRQSSASARRAHSQLSPPVERELPVVPIFSAPTVQSSRNNPKSEQPAGTNTLPSLRNRRASGKK